MTAGTALKFNLARELGLTGAFDPRIYVGTLKLLPPFLERLGDSAGRQDAPSVLRRAQGVLRRALRELERRPRLRAPTAGRLNEVLEALRTLDERLNELIALLERDVRSGLPPLARRKSAMLADFIAGYAPRVGRTVRTLAAFVSAELGVR